MTIHLTSGDVRSVVHLPDGTGEAKFANGRFDAVGDYGPAVAAAVCELANHVDAGGSQFDAALRSSTSRLP